MPVNIGPRIGIEGEAEYRKQINNITQAQKTLTAEMKATESAFGKNASAQEKNAAKAKNLSKQVENQKKKVEELKRMTEQSAQKFGENATQTLKWKEALANAEAELNRLNSELDKTSKNDWGQKLENAGKSLQNAGQKISSVGDTLTKNVTVPLVAIGAASIAAYNEVDDAMDIIVKKTGATGDELKSMEKSAKSIAKTIPTSFEKSAKAVGEVNTRFGVTGEELEDLSTYFLEFADLNETDVSNSVDKVQKSMKAFKVGTKDAKKVLDVMNATGQRTGVSMDTLSTSMVKNAASLQEMGLNIYQATEFLGDLEVSGADSATVMQGLKTALKNAADEGVTLPEKLSEFESIMNSSASDTEKLNAAIEIFGSKAGPAIYEACKKGGLSFQQLGEDATKYFGNVQNTYESTLGPESSLTTTMNSLKATGAEVGETLLTVLEPAVSAVGGYISELGNWYSSLDSNTQRTVSNVIAATAVGGPILKGFGRIITGAGEVVSGIAPMAESLGSLGAYAGPIALVAGAVGVVALTMATSHWKIPDYDQLMADSEALGAKIESIQTKVDSVSSYLNSVTLSVNTDAEPLYMMQRELHECFDENGNLKDGMAETASYIMTDLNKAMGTDLSTDFTGSMDQNIQALAAVDSAIDNHIEKIKEQAIMEAVNSQYGTALTNKQEMIAAESEAYEQLMDVMTRMQGVEAELAQQKLDYANGIDVDMEKNADLRRELTSLNEVLDERNQKYVAAAGGLAEATTQVEGLNTAYEMLKSSDPSVRSEAPEYFANITTNAKKASKAVGDEYASAINEVSKSAAEFAEDPWTVEIEVTNVEKEMKDAKKRGEKIISNMTGRVTGIDGASAAANIAKGTAVSIMSGVTGRLSTIGNVVGVASAALSTANSVLSRITGRVTSISVGDALSSAWSAMQSYFNSNPLTSYVREVVTTVKSGASKFFEGWFAAGGIVGSESIIGVGEAGPEAIIPLSASRRGRAMDLYRQVGSILGVGSGGNTTNNTNNNNISINVYATANQSADEIAEIVSRKISAQVYSKRTVFS